MIPSPLKAAGVVALLILCGPALAQEGGLSLSDLDALMEEDTATRPVFDRAVVTDLMAMSVFFVLAMVSFFKKSRMLKYATMVYAIVYMGVIKANLVSVVHIFGLLEWNFPIFQYNLPWFLLMGFTVLTTVLWGRIYCGRICAFGALTQLMDRILPQSWRYDPPAHIDRKANMIKYVILFAAIGYFLATGSNQFYRYIEPFWIFTFSGNTVMWVLAGALLLASVFIRNFYCRYLCSLGAGLGLLSQFTVFRIKRHKQCDTCKLCDKECEWGAIQGPKISLSECVRCDDCEILYNDKARCVHHLMIAKLAGKQTPAAPVTPAE